MLQQIKWSSALLAALMLAGCASGTSAPDPGAVSGGSGPEGSGEPVTLTFYSSGPTFTNTEFKTLITDPVKKKFPHITINRIEPPSTTTPEELFSSGTVPDILFISTESYYRFYKLGVVQDLRDYIKKYNFDESRLKPFLYDAIKDTSSKGEILGLPFNSNQHILYYNKDIFDKFGVPYPSDKQMTWEEALELGKQLTRTENGVNYIGIDLGGPLELSKSIANPIIDPETGKAVLDTPDWLRMFKLAKQNYEVPGFIGKDNLYVYGRDFFMKDRTLAMRPAWLANMVGPMEELRQQGIEVNWDIAPVPTFSERLGKAREAQVHSLVLSSKSKHKDAAFQVMSHILSDEVQRLLSRNGRVPAVINSELEKEYGADIAVLKGKKIHNVFAAEPLKTHKTHEFENDIRKFVTEATKEVAVGGADVNTAIRKASEAIDKEVERLRKNQ